MKLRRMLAAILCLAMVATSSATANVVSAQEQNTDVVIDANQSDSLLTESEPDEEETKHGTDVVDAGQNTETDLVEDKQIEDTGDTQADEDAETIEEDVEDSDALANAGDSEEAEADDGDELASTNVDNFSVYGSKWVKAADLFGQYVIDHQMTVPAVNAAKAGDLPTHTSGLYACFFLPYDKDTITSLDSTYDNYSIEIAAPDGHLLDRLYFRDIDDNYILRRVVFADEDKIADRDADGNGVVWAADSIEVYTNDDQSASRPTAKYAKYFYFIDLGEYISDDTGAYAFRVNIGSTGNHSDWCYLNGYNQAPGQSVSAASALKWTNNENGSFDGKVSWTAPGDAPAAYIVKLYKMNEARDMSENNNKKVLETDTLIKSVKTDNVNAFLITDHGNMTSEEGLKYYYTVRSVSADPLTTGYSAPVFSNSLATRLSAPTDASWKDNDGTATSSANWKWQKTSDLDTKIKQFSVTLLKNGEAIATRIYPTAGQDAIDVTGAQKSYTASFAEELNGITPSSADYTFTVTAVTDKTNRPFIASSESAESDSPWIGESLGTLVWNTGKASIVTFNVRREGEYTLYLYKDKKSIYQKSLGKLANGQYNYDLKEYMESAGQYQVKVTEKSDKTFTPETEIHSITISSKLPNTITFELRKGTGGEQTLKITDNMAINTAQADAFSGGAAAVRGKGQFDVMIGNVRFRATAANNYTAEIPNLDTYIVSAGSTSIKVRALSADTSTYLHSDWVTYNGASSNVSLNVTGKAGDNIDYKLTGKKGDAKLVLTGTGDMYDYYNPNEVIPADGFAAPWACLGASLKSVTIDDGITKIGNYAFINMTGLTAVKLPSALVTIGDYGFYGCKGLKTVEFPMNVDQIGKCAFGNTTALSKAVFTGAAPATVYRLRDENSKIDADASFYQNTTLYYSPRYTEGWTEAITTVNKVRYWKDYKVVESVIPLEKITVKYFTDAWSDDNVNVYTSLGPGQLNIKAFPYPADASNINITWKSSNTSVAKILSSSGNTAKLELTGKAGYATITAVSKYNSKITDTLTIASYSSTDKNLNKTAGGYWVKSGSNYYYMEIKTAGNVTTKNVVTGWQKVPTYNDWVKWNSSSNASKIKETGNDGLEGLSEWHYFNAKTGARMTGWLTEYEKDKNGNTILYYLDPTKGSLTYGHAKISGRWYYFNEASDTANVTPKTCNGKPSNYANSEIIGCAKIGWLGNSYVDGTKYYNANGQALTGWNEVGEDKWFYFDGNGIKQTGWTKAGSYFYYLGNDGVKQYGDAMTTTYRGMKTYAELDLTANDLKPTDKTVTGGINKFLLAGKNFDNKNETNNGKLVSGWDGNNEKYYSPVSFQMQTGFVKVGSSYYYLKTKTDTDGNVTAETGKKIRYAGTASDGTVDYYITGNKMTELPATTTDTFKALPDDTPIYRFNKNGVLTKTYRKADYNNASPTVNKNTADGVYQKEAGQYYYIKSGNFGTGFVSVTTKSAEVLAPTTEDPNATKSANITHTWYFDPEDSLARRGILNISGKYYLFDQEFHQVKEKAYFTKKDSNPAVYDNVTYPANVFVNIKDLTDASISGYNKTGTDLVYTIVKPEQGHDVTGIYNKDSDNSHTYWFKGGVLTTGWFKVSYIEEVNGKKVTKYDYFYFDPTAGDNYGRKLTNGWYNISGSWYEFDAEGKAVIHTSKEENDDVMTATITPMKADNSATSGNATDYYQLTDAAGKSKGWTRIVQVSGKGKAVNPVDGFYSIKYKVDGVYDNETDAGVTYLTKGIAGSGFKSIKCASGYTTTAKSRKFYFTPATGAMEAGGFAKVSGKFYYFYTGNEKLGDPDSDTPILTGGDYVKGELAGNVWLAVVTAGDNTTTYVIPATADATRAGNAAKYYTDKYRNGPVDATLAKANTKLYYIQSDGTVKTGWLTLSYKAEYTDDYKDPITKEQPKSRTITIKEFVYFNPAAVPEDVDSFNVSTYGQMLRSSTVDNGGYHVDKYGIRQ